MKKGYSYQDLSEILEEQGILISASTLKQYLTDINKESASKRKRSKSGRSQTTKSEQTSLSESSLKPDKDTRLSETESDNLVDTTESELDIDLNKDVNTYLEKSDKDLNTVESNNIKESSNSVPKKQSVTSRSKYRASTKTKTKKSSGYNQDLSSDFNQY